MHQNLGEMFRAFCRIKTTCGGRGHPGASMVSLIKWPVCVYLKTTASVEMTNTSR